MLISDCFNIRRQLLMKSTASIIYRGRRARSFLVLSNDVKSITNGQSYINKKMFEKAEKEQPEIIIDKRRYSLIGHQISIPAGSGKPNRMENKRETEKVRQRTRVVRVKNIV